jgi:glycosyltransferase involved in cell wall biosynthesis
MKVLAITTHRPEEVLEPISHMDTENVVLNVETTGGGVPPVWKIVTTVRNAILTHDPDIVLLDAYETIGVVTSLLCLRYRVPVVCRLVGNKWREYSEEFYTRAKDDGNYAELGQYYISMAMNRVTFALASGFVVVSTELKQVAQDQTSCPPERIRVVPVSIDPETMNGSSETARRRMGIDEERVLLTVTNLNYRGKMQGVKRILDEIQPILDERSDVAYVVAGGGRRHADVQEYVEKSFEG